MGILGITTKKDRQIEALNVQNQSLIKRAEEKTAVATIRGIETRRRDLGFDETFAYYLDGVGLNVGLQGSDIDSANIDYIYKLVPIYAACVDGISREISNSHLKVIPAYKGAKGTKKEKARIEEIFNHPNVNWQSISSFMYELSEDTLNFGKSVIEKCFARDYPDILLELWSRSADQFYEKKDDHGVITGYEQRIGEKKDWVRFTGEQIVMTHYNSRAKKHKGIPMIEGILSACNIIIKALDFIVRSFDYNEIPPGVLWIKGANNQQLKDIKNKFLEKSKEGGLELLITMLGGNFELIQWITLKQSIQDMKMLEHINNAERIIYNRFGVSADVMSDIGDVNKATASVMKNIRSSQLINPLIRLHERAWNEEIVYPHLSKDWKIKLEPQAEKTRQQLIDESKVLIPLGCALINQMREELGEEPVDGGDEAIFVIGSRIIRVRDLPEGDLNPQLNPYTQNSESNNETGFNASEPTEGQNSGKLLNEYRKIWEEKKNPFIRSIMSAYFGSKNITHELSKNIDFFYKKMELAFKSIYGEQYDRSYLDKYMKDLDLSLLDNIKKDSNSLKNLTKNAIKDYESGNIETKNQLAMNLNAAYEIVEKRLDEFIEVE